ncbi:6-bladed beta-propeller [Cohnella kolymensis]|uniref:6-bladed beta-propeller n=1 Tax=Cohnella kolymensis TaxID=1590652 RepID=UPI0006974ECA|nr:6-bladed beta-propeller [Cohnella kolymensis]
MITKVKPLFGGFIRKVLIILSIPLLVINFSSRFVVSADPGTSPTWVSFGNFGSGNGQFDHPRGIAVDSSLNIYVADTGNNRIQKFASDGTYVTSFGTSGSGNGQFNSPSDVELDYEGNIYVADTGNNRIQKFDKNGNYLLTFGPDSVVGPLNSPRGIALSAGLYVADTGNNRLIVFQDNGDVYLLIPGPFLFPFGVVLNFGIPFVADTANQRIVNSDVTWVWGRGGSGNGEFNSPQGIAAQAGNIYVADTLNNRIQEFDGSSNFIQAWGSKGAGKEQFDEPSGVAVDQYENIYVADTWNNRIQIIMRNSSASIPASNVTVSNHPAPTPDTVSVSGLAAGDVVKVYDAAADGNLLGSSTVGAGETSATVSILQLGTGSGTVYVSVTNLGKAESSRTAKTYGSEPVVQSTAPSASDVTVSNHTAPTPDTVSVSGLAAGDMVKVYDAAADGNLLGSSTVGAGETSATVSILQLGTGSGTVYVSVTNLGKAESLVRPKLTALSLLWLYSLLCLYSRLLQLRL